MTAWARVNCRSLEKSIFDHDDFMLDPPKKFFRLGPGREVRLRYGYAITCNEVIQDDEGNVTELLCTYDPLTAKGKTPDGRKIKGIIHWVSAAHALDAEIRVYDRLYTCLLYTSPSPRD